MKFLILTLTSFFIFTNILLAKPKTLICVSSKSIGFIYQNENWIYSILYDETRYLIEKRYEYLSKEEKGPLNLHANYQIKLMGSDATSYCNNVDDMIYCEFGLSSFFNIDLKNKKYIYGDGADFMRSNKNKTNIWLQYGVCSEVNH